MTGLATNFLDHAHQWSIEPDLVEQIMGSALDLEHLIEELDRICSGMSSLEAIKKPAIDLEGTDKIRAEVEWFVQHSAERIAVRDAHLMWGSVLSATESVEITFVTTNYDRAIELAANYEHIHLDDGFQPFGQEETVSWIGIDRNKGNPILVKLHGSTDWYADNKSGKPKKLRHPMPLFGRFVLRMDQGQELGSALVLPSREKLLSKAPYPRLSQAFLNVADSCDLAAFVGSSLRDNHIRDAAQSIATRVPVFIVNPQGENLDVEGAIAIAQHASTFLVSTLPNALRTADPVTVLQDTGPTARTKAGGILSAVRQLLDSGAEPEQRCRSVDELAEIGATLAPKMIRQLLADDNPTVARYALGLVPPSTEAQALIEEAENSHHNDDPVFSEELSLLRSIVS